MSAVATTSMEAEADVTQARADLSATLDQLRDNLRPSQLVAEVMTKPKDAVSHWLEIYGDFAKTSMVSRLIIGTAGLLIASSLVRRHV